MGTPIVDDAVALHRDLLAKRGELPVEIDGTVFKVDDLALQAVLAVVAVTPDALLRGLELDDAIQMCAMPQAQINPEPSPRKNVPFMVHAPYHSATDIYIILYKSIERDRFFAFIESKVTMTLPLPFTIHCTSLLPNEGTCV